MLTVERVLVLRQVEMFAKVDEEVLIGLATQASEVELGGEQPLMRQGEPGRELYVVVEGSLRVERDGQLVAELGEHSVVGELAALDPQPRSATVTASAPTRLLRIDHDILVDELMVNPDLAWSVIRFLVRRFTPER